MDRCNFHIKIKTLYLIFGILFSPCLFAQDNLNYSSKSAIESNLPIADLQRFSTVLEHIRNYYVKEVKDSDLIENAIRGMLSGLDPHSAFLDIEEFSELKISTSGKFGGLGIEVTMEDGFVKVITPIDDSPATKSGIKAGDLIMKINDHQVKGMSLKDAVELMRGKPKTDINLTIFRQGEDKPLQIKVMRDIINVQSVRSKVIDDYYGYVRISQFQNDTGDSLRKELSALKKKIGEDFNGVVLDLRNNPGGVLEASVQVVDAFLDKDKLAFDKKIVFTKGRIPGYQIVEKSQGKDILGGAPLVVLVNEGSASAAEIVAGAIRDHKRGLILGQKTFGKGSVQTVLPLKDKRGLKLTTALYYTPAGDSIQAVGINPDIVVQNLKFNSGSNNNQQASELLMIKEANLQGHLSNTKEKADATKEENKSTGSYLYTDYQLHEAINILKGLHLAKKSKGS